MERIEETVLHDIVRGGDGAGGPVILRIREDTHSERDVESS